jgi:hypothetical protein
LILIAGLFLFATFRSFFGGGGVAATLRLPARVRKYPALGPADESSADSTLGVWAKIRITEIGVSPLKLGMGRTKLSRGCKCVYRE